MRSRFSRAGPAVLYAVTALVTGQQVLWVISWSVWGRVPQSTECVALLGACALLGAAGAALVRPQLGAVLATGAVVAIWPFYVGAVVGSIARARADQDLSVLYVRWDPGPEPLSVTDTSLTQPRPQEFPTPPSTRGKFVATGGVPGIDDDELALLQQAGLTGKLTVVGTRRTGNGPPARAIVVAHRQVDGQVELRQPDKTAIIYVQSDGRWNQYPPLAPTIDRTIRLEVAVRSSLRTGDSIELVTGGRVGGTAFNWSNSESGRP